MSEATCKSETTREEGIDALLAAAQEHGTASTSTSSSPAPPPLAGPSNVPGNTSETLQHASIFIIGMRGSGKVRLCVFSVLIPILIRPAMPYQTTVGLLASTFLQRPLIDADALFESRVHMSMATFVAQHGWAAFRERETQLLDYLLKSKATGHIIVLGGGVVEREENRRMLQQHHGPVIHVCRQMREQLHLLNHQPPNSKPYWVNLHESYRSIYLRRMPLYDEACSLTFANLEAAQASPGIPSSLALKHVEQAVRNFVQKLFSHNTLPSWPQLDLSSANGPRTQMLVLKDADEEACLNEKIAREVSQGVDAVEFRVDTCLKPDSQSSSFSPGNALYESSYRIASLRRFLHLPVVYAVRTVREQGVFEGSAADLMRLIAHGFRLLCDIVEISLLELDDDQIRSLMQHRKPGTKVMLSVYWTEADFGWEDTEPQATLQRAISLAPDVIKLVKPAHSMLDNWQAVQLQERMAIKYPSLPLIVNNYGTLGHLSHCFNLHLTPVTHASLPSSSSPTRERHLLTAVELERGLVASGITEMRQVYDFDEGIGASSTKLLADSAALCLSGFEQLALPFELRFLSKPFVMALEDAMQSPTFGGALVTQTVAPDDPLATPVCRTIGRVDTVCAHAPPVRLSSPSSIKLVKHNKRVSAIRKNIVRHLSPVNAINSGSEAVLEGASDHSGREALYALLSLGIKNVYMLRCAGNVLNPPLELPPEATSTAPRLVPIASLEELPTHRKHHRSVTIVVTMSQPSLSIPRVLAHPLGGVVLNLSSRWCSWSTISDNWIDVSRQAVEIELVREQFFAITGKMLPRL